MPKTPNQALLAQRAFRQGGDTRLLKRLCANGNVYALARLDRLGLQYVNGTISPKE